MQETPQTRQEQFVAKEGAMSIPKVQSTAQSRKDRLRWWTLAVVSVTVL